MKKSEKAAFVVQKLEELYPKTTIPLEHKDAFTLLIAVLLSAQCTDKRVNEVTPELFSMADSPEKMKQLDIGTIEQIVKPCGLYKNKSKAISQLSKILVDRYNGEVPDKMELLEALPGVGHKTASVVMAQAFNVPAFPVDTHIHRLIYRWGLSSGKNVVQTEKDCKRLFPKEKWNELHLRIIYFGREYCKARGHDPKNCPICSKIGRKSLFH